MGNLKALFFFSHLFINTLSSESEKLEKISTFSSESEKEKISTFSKSERENHSTFSKSERENHSTFSFFLDISPWLVTINLPCSLMWFFTVFSVTPKYSATLFNVA